MNVEKQKKNKYVVSIISFVFLLVITFGLFKMNANPKQQVNITSVVSESIAINNELIAQQKKRNDFTSLLNGAPEDFEKAGEIVINVIKTSTNQAEKDWYKKQYLNKENSYDLYKAL